MFLPSKVKEKILKRKERLRRLGNFFWIFLGGIFLKSQVLFFWLELLSDVLGKIVKSCYKS